MKAILEFNLPEDETEHRQALDGYKWELVVWNLQNACMKHGYLYQIQEAKGSITPETILHLISDHMEDKSLEFSP